MYAPGLYCREWTSDTEFGYVSCKSATGLTSRRHNTVWDSAGGDAVSVLHHREAEGGGRLDPVVDDCLRIGRREMEIVLLGYFLINICQIFSLGGFLTNVTVVQVRILAFEGYS